MAHVRGHRELAVVRIVGDVDMTTTSALKGAVDELRAAAPRTVVVDLSTGHALHDHLPAEARAE